MMISLMQLLTLIFSLFPVLSCSGFQHMYQNLHNTHSSSTSLQSFWGSLDQALDTIATKALFLQVDNDNNSNNQRKMKDKNDPNKVLEIFEIENFDDKTSLQVAHESLRNFLSLWGRRLEEQPDKQLTTPISVTDFKDHKSYDLYQFLDSSSFLATDLDDDQVIYDDRITTTIATIGTPEDFVLPTNVSMKLKFRPSKRYLSYKEQKGLEKGVIPDRKGGKVDAWSPGGVLLQIESISTLQNQDQNNTTISYTNAKSDPDSSPTMDPNVNGGKSSGNQFDRQSTAMNPQRKLGLRLQVRRCDIDTDTIIKFSSERAILRRLREALRIWVKVRAMS